ncbi:FMN reductase (NADH) NtaB [Actinomadura rubteroloni]|uniref:FMN reductase (NADH) NtaB n=1 Tax=Actinomadura rubteroloni TaxID=1926885 RepID=A0A2P4UFF9_9ACTN|nr:flavin reductase family protein [Actinomadura rubteroloni]POM23769.1 FMN reductase (NADH) NtaB [Actinomadura rubteroloni]
MTTARPSDGLVDAAALRRTCGLFATGVTVITSAHGGMTAGTTVNSFTSVSLDPPLVLFCLHRESRLHEIITGSRAFAVNLLHAEQGTLAHAFARRSTAVLDEVDHRRTPSGTPVFAESLAYLDCRLAAEYGGGDHSILVGEVVDLAIHDAGSDPLVFFGGSLHSLDNPLRRRAGLR